MVISSENFHVRWIINFVIDSHKISECSAQFLYDSHSIPSRPGARPTNDISIEFEIRPNYAVLWFKMYSPNYNKILHMSRQYSCRDMYKISLWSVEHILNYSTPNFCGISNWIKIPLMAPGPWPHWFLVVRCHLWACWPVICKLSAWGLQHVGLTQLPLDKMAAISHATFWNAFSWMKSIVSWFKFHWNLFLSVQLMIFQ